MSEQPYKQIYWFHSLGDDKGNRYFWGGSKGFIADTSEREITACGCNDTR